MKCVKCEKEIDEAVKFCPECGFNIEKAKKDLDEVLKLKEEETKIKINPIIEERKTTERKKSSVWPMTILVLLVLAILFLSANETRQIAVQEQYEEPVYVEHTSTYNCGFLGLKTCSKQESVISHYETKYRTVYHSVTKPKFAWMFGLGQTS